MAANDEDMKIAVVRDVRRAFPSLHSTSEKALFRVIDEITVLGLSDNDAEFYDSFSTEERKIMTRKIDIRLVPMLATLYLFAHLDRANIGNAKIEGMDTDLNLSGIQWNISLSVFFIFYILLELPSNIVLQKFQRPSIYLGILATSWGIVMMLHGFVQNFAGLVALRLLLGIFEAGFFPAAMYLCSLWYSPRALQSRIAWFYCTSALSGAFSGLLAAAISLMDGTGGYQGWRWIFIIEGLGTILIGISCFFLLIDSPKLSKWLNAKEIRFLDIQSMVKAGGHASADSEETKIRFKDVRPVLLNWRLYLQAVPLFCASVASYGTKFTLPTITKEMGFSNTDAQLMTVPAFVVGAISSIAFAKASDHFYWRMPFVAAPLLILTVGYSIVISMKGEISGPDVGLTYFGIMLTTIGIYPIQPATAAWVANNIPSAKHRGLGLGLLATLGSLGSIPGSFMYFDADAPTYYIGFGLSLALGATAFIVVFLLEFSYMIGNKKKAETNVDEARARYSQKELLDMGDKSPLFKFIL